MAVAYHNMTLELLHCGELEHARSLGAVADFLATQNLAQDHRLRKTIERRDGG